MSYGTYLINTNNFKSDVAKQKNLWCNVFSSLESSKGISFYKFALFQDDSAILN